MLRLHRPLRFWFLIGRRKISLAGVHADVASCLYFHLEVVKLSIVFQRVGRKRQQIGNLGRREFIEAAQKIIVVIEKFAAGALRKTYPRTGDRFQPR